MGVFYLKYGSTSLSGGLWLVRLPRPLDRRMWLVPFVDIEGRVQKWVCFVGILRRLLDGGWTWIPWPSYGKNVVLANNTSRLCDVIRARAEQGPTRTLFSALFIFFFFRAFSSLGSHLHIYQFWRKNDWYTTNNFSKPPPQLGVWSQVCSILKACVS